MLYFLIFVAIILFVSIQKYARDTITKSVLVMFVGYWFTCLIFSTFHFYDIYPITDTSYFYLTTGVVSFVIGMLSVKSPANSMALRDKHLGVFDDTIEAFIKSKIFVALIVFTAVFGFSYAKVAIALAVIGGRAEMWDKGDLIFGGNTFAIQYYNNIMTPLFHISSILVLFVLIKKKIKKFPLQFSAFVCCIVSYAMLAGSRNILMIIMLYAILCYIILSKSEELKRFSIKRVISLALVLLFVVQGITLMTNYRKEGSFTSTTGETDNNSSLELIYKYSELPFVLFDRALTKDYLGKFDYQFGRLTLSGLDYWFVNLVNRFGADTKSTQEIVQYLDDNYFPYSPENAANYAYTAFFYHYIDFGYFGLILWPILLGMIYKHFVNRFIRCPNMYSFLLICICFFILMHTIFSCYLNKPWMIVFLLFLIYKDKKSKAIPLKS